MERFKVVAAVHLFLASENHILLLRRFNTGYEDGNYSVPAGHLDGDEPIISAAIREAKEECGITIAPDDLEVVGVMHRRSNDERIDFFLATTKWTGVITNAEPHKCDDLSWYPVNELPHNLIPYVRHALDAYRQGTWFTEFGWS